jgi:hypothetical protein
MQAKNESYVYHRVGQKTREGGNDPGFCVAPPPARTGVRAGRSHPFAGKPGSPPALLPNTGHMREAIRAQDFGKQ